MSLLRWSRSDSGRPKSSAGITLWSTSSLGQSHSSAAPLWRKPEVNNLSSSHIDHITSGVRLASAMRVKRVKENNDHLTYHSLASKWVANRIATEEEGLEIILSACHRRQVFFFLLGSALTPDCYILAVKKLRISGWGVSYPTTNQAWPSLASKIRQDVASYVFLTQFSTVFHSVLESATNGYELWFLALPQQHHFFISRVSSLAISYVLLCY